MAFLVALATTATAAARPTAPEIFCQVYPTATQCRGSIAACTMCHSAPPALNSYGQSIASTLDRRTSFEQALPGALAATEQADADADGRSNAQELTDGTWPGNAASFFVGEATLPARASAEFAYQRISVAFCGTSATYAELETLRAAADTQVVLHAKLTTCLTSAYWTQEVLVHLADPLVRPVALLGHCGLAFLDFEPDYNIFLWAMTADHDASEMLTATYFVDRNDAGELEVVDTLPASRTRAGVACTSPFGRGGPTAQAVAAPFRAGVLTTANFLLNNTQVTYLPRVSAGIAYRNWFGADIAQYEALYSVPQEPRDIDHKGLKNPVCASCHSTLDPLAYAYAYYYGGGPTSEFGAYSRGRPEVYLGGLGATRAILDDWYNDPPVPRLFGKAVEQEYKLPEGTSSLVRLAAEAAKSDLFARHLTRMIFREVVGGDPEPRDADEFEQLWRGLRANRFSVNKLCHALIDTRAFGSPR